MPPKIDPRDWDRLFRPGAPRRGGPLRALANVLIFGTVLGLLGGGAFFAVQFRDERARAQFATQVAGVATQNAQTIATRTARALAQTATSAAVAPTPAALTPGPPPLGVGSVRIEGNLRSEVRLVPETVLGLLCVGDEVAFLEQQTVDAGVWYRIRVTSAPTSCNPQRVSPGVEGWASSTILSAPTP